jgi:aryl-alcohol dehydrogenase-like predicted oxidoreductase
VVVTAAVATGRLTPHARAPDPRLASRASEHGVGVDAVALAAALRQPWCDVVLSGAVTEDQLDANLAAATVTLDDAELETLAALTEPPAAYWETRAGLGGS